MQPHEGPSISYNCSSMPTSSTPKNNVKPTPNMNKVVVKIWQKTRRNGRNDYSGCYIRRRFPDTTRQKEHIVRQHQRRKSSQANDWGNVEIFAPGDNIEEEHDLALFSPAKSSISSLHASNFYNPEQFGVSSKLLSTRVCFGVYTIPKRIPKNS